MHQPDFEEVFGLNAAYAEKVYGDYLEAPDSVPEEWRSFFDTELPVAQRAVSKPKPAPAAAPACGCDSNKGWSTPSPEALE